MQNTLITKKALEKQIENNASQQKMAEHFNISRDIIKGFLKKFGLKTNRAISIANTKFDVQLNCANCNKNITKKLAQVSKTINHFCSRSCAATYNNKLYPKRVRQFDTIKSLTEYHKGDRRKALAYIRRVSKDWYDKLSKEPCANCGYTKHSEICHIKAVSSFPEDTNIDVINHKDNIIQLCPNCHWEFDSGNLDISHLI